jgi:D-alanyl-D-alanine carboxypeptidase
MEVRMRAVLASLLALSIAAPVPASPAAPAGPTMADALAAIRAYAPRAMAEQGTPGLSVAITDRTHTLATITLGYANRETRAPVTPSTRFAIGSITKSMTAVALLELRDEHRVDLNAPITRYLPWFSIHSDGQPILMHEILSHTAGLPDDYTVTPGYAYSVWALRDAHTLFTPGTSWSYSNDGYAAIGAVIAALDHRRWSASLAARVLDPLGMNDTATVFTPQTLESAATGYEYRDADRPPSLAPPLTPSRVIDFVDPAGSVLSTPGDMARYLRFYLDGGAIASGRRLISASSFERLTEPDRYRNGRPAGSAVTMLGEAPQFYRQYGYGLSVFNGDREYGGDHVIGHTGGISGYTACFQADLTRGFGIIAMANLVEEPLHPCAIVLYAMRVLRAQSLGQALPAPPPPPDPARVADAGAYAATYTGDGGRSIVVRANGDRLQLIDRGAAYGLYPRGGDLFWTSDPRFAIFLLSFGRNARGRVVDVTYGSEWLHDARYAGPHTWRYPTAWNRYAGRYEADFWGSPQITRVVIVKGALTFDGVQPIVPRADGSFAAGPSVVRFGAIAAGKAQRMRIDGFSLYRVALP